MISRIQIVQLLDAEIERLRRARQVLTTNEPHSASLNKANNAHRRGRHMSVEARKRISDAQKKRWAARRQQARKK